MWVWLALGHHEAARGALEAHRGTRGEKRVSGNFCAVAREGSGDQGTRASWPGERGVRGEHGGGRSVARHCGAQCTTVDSGDGAGEVFAKMAARGALLPFALNFGGEAEGSEGVLVRCSGGQGELV